MSQEMNDQRMAVLESMCAWRLKNPDNHYRLLEAESLEWILGVAKEHLEDCVDKLWLS